ncbi:MAG: hypothetical protein IPM08_16390 [Actinomycetales bacterium]|nr:hypothetical protein [Actinomycetales bacterium]
MSGYLLTMVGILMVAVGVFAAWGGSSIVLSGVICLAGVAVTWHGIRALLDAR